MTPADGGAQAARREPEVSGLLCVSFGALAVVTLAAQSATPASAQAVGGEVIIIDSVNVSGALVSAVCGLNGKPALPMTIVGWSKR